MNRKRQAVTDPLYTQGVQLLKSGQYADAESCFLRMLAVNPYSATVMNLVGICRARQDQYAEGLEWMRKALALDSQSADIHHNIGPIFRILGDFASAEKHYREAIRLKPDYAEAYFNLSSVKKFSAGDPALAGVAQLLEGGQLSAENQCFAHFALGKMYDDIGEYDAAFEHYRQGNQLRGVTFSPESHQAMIDEIMEAFTPAALQRRAGQGLGAERIDADAPVFVLGMPRSGTTLVEQILASHPEVFGAGELRDITSIVHTMPQHDPHKAPYPRYLESLPDHVLGGFAEAYLRRLRTLHPTARRIVDKMPQNYLFLGVIAMMFPQASIIHCRRHPLDTCLSCYFQRFRVSQEYSYDLGHLGRYYRSYRQLMDHWRRLLPGRIYDACYEDLVSEPDRVTRELLEHCRLPFHENCLQAHRTQRPVTTASNLQVRQPLYRTSVEKWRRYEKHLSPLLESLRWNEKQQDLETS